MGPGGVTVVNALLLSGRLTIVPARPGAPAQLLVGGHDHTSVVTEVESAVNLVRRALSAGGRPAPPVHGALCVPGDWELAPFATCELRDVTIDGPGTVALIAGRDGSLSAAAVARTAERLQRAFPSAGPRRYAA